MRYIYIFFFCLFFASCVPHQQTSDGNFGGGLFSSAPKSTSPQDQNLDRTHTGSIGNNINEILDPGTRLNTSNRQATTDLGLSKMSVEMAFVDTDIREFSRIFFSEIIKRPYTIDPSIDGRITIRSNGKISGTEALRLARDAIAANGATLGFNDGVFVVARTGQLSNNTGNALRTIQLKHIDAASARAAIEPFMGNGAQIIEAKGSILTLRSDERMYKSVSALLETLDIEKFRTSSFGLIPLRYAEAGQVAVELDTIMQNSNVNGYSFTPVSRMNALLVATAQPSHLQFARKWIKRLDNKKSSNVRVHAYSLQHRKAADIVPLLSEIFSGTGGSDGNNTAPGLTPVEVTDTDIRQNPTSGNSANTGVMNITADKGTNTVLVRGTDQQFQQVSSAIRRLDVPTRQVYIEATIAEVRLNKELEHGVRWFFEYGGFSIDQTDNSTGTVGKSHPGFNFSASFPRAGAVISALEAVTDVNIISTPTLTVSNNELATLQVGDQIPVATKEVQDTTTANAPIVNNIEFRDTGIILKVRPRVQGNGKVGLEVVQEVSSVVPSTSGGVNTPTIRQRKIESKVIVDNGSAFVLGGLVSKSSDTSSSGFPGARKNNILDAIFNTKEKNHSRSELVVIIRPVVIDSQQDMNLVVRDLAKQMRGISNLSRF